MADSAMVADEVIGMRAVALLCGTTAKTIHDWLRLGAFPLPMQAVPRGRLRWKRSAIEQWLAGIATRRREEVPHGT